MDDQDIFYVQTCGRRVKYDREEAIEDPVSYRSGHGALLYVLTAVPS